jgi:predicted metal-dependent HD superfamily phosphohydrolase
MDDDAKNAWSLVRFRIGPGMDKEDNEDTVLDAKWRDILQKAYSDESRHYHTLEHVHAMLRELRAEKPHLDPHKYALLELATWFHDAVYLTTETSVCNEIDSALLVERFFQDRGIVFVVPCSSLISEFRREKSPTFDHGHKDAHTLPRRHRLDHCP